MNYPFQQVDVFSQTPCMGNPVAVFLKSDGLDTNAMQRIARWTNLSETTFVGPSLNADYRLRIFTPSTELPFAGHPTLGTAWALRNCGFLKSEQVIQECGFGLINISFEDGRVFFELANFDSQILQNDRGLNLALGISCQKAHIINVGPRWITAEMAEGQHLKDIVIDHRSFIETTRKHKSDGITIYEIMPNASVEVRSFFEANEVVIEDPVCGSGNAAVATHIMKTDNTDRVGTKYEAKQGAFLHRDGRIAVCLGETIKIGGFCHTIFDGIANF